MPGPGEQAKQKSAPTKEDEIAQADDEIEDFEIIENNGIFDQILMVFEKFAQNRLGQMVYGQCDRVLKVVEDTARWSLPQDDSDMKLERPLPWVFFLSLIIWLRVFSFWLNVGSTIAGLPRTTPQSMVYSIQIKRRRLRAIRVRGLQAIRRREQDASSMSSSSSKTPSLMAKVRQLFGSAVCQPGQLRDVPARRIFAQGDNANKDVNKETSERCTTKRPRDDDADLNLTVAEMLNKYANDDSEDDSDYVPNAEDDDNGSESTSSVSSEEETEMETDEPLEDDADHNLTSMEMLNKYANDNSEDDLDYLPNPEDYDNGSRSNSSISSEEETEIEDDELLALTSSLTNSDSMDRSVIEVKENGGPKHRLMPKPMADIKLEPISDADSGNERVKTPLEPESSGKFDEYHHGGQQTTEVETNRPQEQLNTPPQQQQQHQQHLIATLDEAARKKSTPGHETAASLNPILVATTTSAPRTEPAKSDSKDSPTSRNKCCRTITTQTCIEYDWSIVVKTEISHRRQPVQLPKLDCAVQTPLTPASSTEDIFHSPMGSPQHFHTIFHPVPLIKLHPIEVQSTVHENNDGDNDASSAPEAQAWNQPQPQQRQQIQPNQGKPHRQQQHNYHNKNRNKNRR